MATIGDQLTEEQRKAMAKQASTVQGPHTGLGELDAEVANIQASRGKGLPETDPETAAALKALIAARAQQQGIKQEAEAEPKPKPKPAEPLKPKVKPMPASATSEPAAGVQTEALELSIQQRAAVSEIPGATSINWWFRSADEGFISQWWSAQRDADLRDFWMKEGNDILQGAVISMVKKFKAMGWKLDGPEGKVKEMQSVLSNAEFGEGWTTLLAKTLTDYLTQDQGAFWELIGEGDPDGPLEGLPVGVAHLDSSLCQLTGDPVYPVLFRNTKALYCPKCKRKYPFGIAVCPEDQTRLENLYHRLHATRVVHIVDMPSPAEAMKGVGFCAVSRVIASSYVLLKLAQYKNEKLSDLPQAGLLLLNNILPKQWADATTSQQKDRRRLGQELWTNVMVLMGIDPERPISADFVNFSQLPDQFNEKEATELYINIVALAFGVDVREFWPMSAGNLGTATETLVMHQKAKGKGVGDLISTIERAINWHILPEVVTFSFDFTDDDEDLARASLDEMKAKTILSMYLPDPASGETVASRDEVRQMLADNVSYFPEEFLETDVTGSTQADDTDVKAMYGRHITIDHQGRLKPPRGQVLREGKKGGPGSGHYGHAGRPGKRGGSLPGDVAVSIGTGRTAASRQWAAGAPGTENLGKVHAWLDGDDAHRQLGPEFTDWAAGLDKAEKNALHDWVYSPDYSNLNEVMRGQRKMSSMWGDQQMNIERMVPGLDSALDKARIPFTVSARRSICDSPECIATFGSLDAGDEFTDNGYVATGATEIPEGFMRYRPVQANVIIPKGSRAAYLEGTIGTREEYEILIQRGSRFRVIGKNVADGVTTLDLLLLPQGDLPPIPFEPKFVPSLYKAADGEDGDHSDKFVWEVEDITIFKKDTKGGPGSGHHGHAGRPGQVGGSAPARGGALGSDIHHDPTVRSSIWAAVGKTDSTGKEQGGKIYRESDGGLRIETVSGTERAIDMGRSVGTVGCYHTHPIDPELDLIEHIPPSTNDIISHTIDAWESGRDDYTSITVAPHRNSPGVTVYMIRGRPSERPMRTFIESNMAMLGRAIDRRLDRSPRQRKAEGFLPALQDGLKVGAEAMGLEFWWEEWPR